MIKNNLSDYDSILSNDFLHPVFGHPVTHNQTETNKNQQVNLNTVKKVLAKLRSMKVFPENLYLLNKQLRSLKWKRYQPEERFINEIIKSIVIKSFKADN